MSRFNKNGRNLAGDAEQKWLNGVTLAPTSEAKAEAPAKVETPKPDEGAAKTEEDKPRRSLRRRKKKEGDS